MHTLKDTKVKFSDLSPQYSCTLAFYVSSKVNILIKQITYNDGNLTTADLFFNLFAQLRYLNILLL